MGQIFSVVTLFEEGSINAREFNGEIISVFVNDRQNFTVDDSAGKWM